MGQNRTFFIAMLTLAVFARGTDGADLVRAVDVLNHDGVLVIAHRGYSRVAPENTLPAFESAVRIGSDLIELDYHHTQDGVPVVIHDGTLDRTTDADELWQLKSVDIRTQPMSALKDLDAGQWFSPAFAGTRVPSLAASLDTIQNGSMTLIERKSGDAATCVKLLREKGLLQQVVVQAFDWDYVADCHRQAPELVLAALGGRAFDETKLAAIEETGAQIVAWHRASIDSEMVQAIHARGLKVWAWTVDDPDEMSKLVEMGIDGIITNVPGWAQIVVRGAEVPSLSGVSVETR